MNPSLFSVYVVANMEMAKQIWIKLEALGFCLPFQRYSWADAYLKTNGRNIRPCIIVVIYNTTPIMLLPLCVVSKGPLRFIEFIGGEFNDYNAPIMTEYIATLPRREFDDLYKRILRKLPRHDYLNLFRIPRVINGLNNPLIGLDAVLEEAVGHSVLLRDYKSLAKSVLKEVSKKKRKLMAHKIRFEETFDVVAFNTLVGWKRRQFPNSLTESQIAFYLSLIEEKDTRLYRLYIDDELAAAQFALISGRTCTGLIIGYDPKWSDVSPGKMLTMYMLDDLSMSGIELFDAGQGAESYKSDYGDGWYPLYSKKQAATVFGQLYQTARLAVRRLRSLYQHS